MKPYYERNEIPTDMLCYFEEVTPDPIPSVVLDPFWGAGTTGLVALRLGRRALGVELNGSYIEMSHKRIQSDPEAWNLRMQLLEMMA